MKRIILFMALIAMSLQFAMAQGAQGQGQGQNQGVIGEGQNQTQGQGQGKGLRTDRKMMEIKKIITLSPTQEMAIRAALAEHQKTGDSILLKVSDPNVAAQLSYESSKKYHIAFMNALTDEQRVEYIRVTNAPEMQAKAAAKVDVLRESGSYTQAQLDSAQVQIFDYLMLEKVVYTRDKYDYQKQKENIAQLKKLQPARLRQADTQQKEKIEKKYHQGTTKW